MSLFASPSFCLFDCLIVTLLREEACDRWSDKEEEEGKIWLMIVVFWFSFYFHLLHLLRERLIRVKSINTFSFIIALLLLLKDRIRFDHDHDRDLLYNFAALFKSLESESWIWSQKASMVNRFFLENKDRRERERSTTIKKNLNVKKYVDHSIVLFIYLLLTLIRYSRNRVTQKMMKNKKKKKGESCDPISDATTTTTNHHKSVSVWSQCVIAVL